MKAQDELKTLANRLIDGVAGPTDAKRLSALLREQPELREMYIAYLDTHAALCWEYRSEAGAHVQAATSVAIPPGRPRKVVNLIPWSVACAASLLAAFALWRGGPVDSLASPVPESRVAPANGSGQASPLIALVVDEAGAKFAPERGPKGVSIAAGVYELVEGIVHIRFAHGADVVLSGPARLAVKDVSHAELAYGSIRVIAPPTAAGFTVATPAAEYIDLGTEFGLRVDPIDGASDLYVFDGQVNIGDRQSKQILSEEFEGNSSRYVNGVARPAPQLKESDFPDPAAIGFARWQEYERRMIAEPSLLAFYSFQRTADDASLPNVHTRRAIPDGRILGARWASGRWPGKESLLFDRNDDFVELEVPGEHGELSIAAWVKVERLDFELNAIFNSNHSAAGGVHFQLTRQSLPRGGVLGTKSVDAFVGEPVPVGQWAHVAMVLSTRDRSQKIYVNGQLSRSRPQLAAATIRPGAVRLGNWLPTVEGIESVRALRGRIDELALWSRVLSEEDLASLVEAGRPGRLWNESSFAPAANR